MKREIKFRAWDGDKKEMHLPEYTDKEDFHILSDGSIVYTQEYGYDRHELTNRRPDTWVLMQFTGLHDKNGKDIYEGDILDGRILVTWRNDLASFALSKQGWAYDHYFGEAVDPGHTEVIGNIHQNPELLQP